MPIYEYRCRACRRLTSVFTRTSVLRQAQDEWEEAQDEREEGRDAREEAQDDRVVVCEHCGSNNTARAVSSFAYHRSAADVIAGLPPPGEERLEDYKDPRVIGRWVEKKFDEYGMALPESTRQMIDAAREGVMPEPLND